MSMGLDTLLDGFASAPPLPIAGLALDSRRVRAGDAFFAVRGKRAHGLEHASQAIAKGAAAIVWEPADGIAAPQVAVPQIAVTGLNAHLGEIAARFHGRPSDQLFVAGVTGTDGKTSTAHLVAQVLDAVGMDCAYIGTLGCGRLHALDEATHTTPDPLSLHRLLSDFVADGARACAMEVSSHALDQQRVGGVSFDAAVLTNLGRDHLDYHGTIEHYAASKKRLFVNDGRALIFNRDDAEGERWAAELRAVPKTRLTTYGLEDETSNHVIPAKAGIQGGERALQTLDSRLRGNDGVGGERFLIGRALRLDEQGLRLDLETSWGDATCATKLPGRFNAYNLMAAFAVVLEAGVDFTHAIAALSQVRTVPGRIEGFRGPRAAPLVVVDYAHTPQALEQILLALRPHARGKLWCVFGCGGDRDRGKRPLMGAVAARLADELIITDDNPRSEDPAEIVAHIRAGLPDGKPAEVIHDRARAIETAVREAKTGDVVVVAGKGHETTQTYGSEVRTFSDRDFVAELVSA